MMIDFFDEYERALKNEWLPDDYNMVNEFFAYANEESFKVHSIHLGIINNVRNKIHSNYGDSIKKLVEQFLEDDCKNIIRAISIGTLPEAMFEDIVNPFLILITLISTNALM
ncbi:hypothetical protein LJB89_03120 [Tyzzerella sp. OttesenSCG-928-J15]|nr:hypothetical protein [Tyzzerella sp. OttesenSCG-928-J15]